jgi:hypothetical protein
MHPSAQTVRPWLRVVGLHSVPHAASGGRRRLGRLPCWAWMRRMRVLIWGRWSWSIHQGGIHSGRPSAFIRQVQPFCRKWVWWYRQSKVRLQTLR